MLMLKKGFLEKKKKLILNIPILAKISFFYL
jgi:hypothetical protein